MFGGTNILWETNEFVVECQVWYLRAGEFIALVEAESDSKIGRATERVNNIKVIETIRHVKLTIHTQEQTPHKININAIKTIITQLFLEKQPWISHLRLLNQTLIPLKIKELSW